MNNNVLVIGNGYDLAHGLKTKYEDFIDWLRTISKEDWCSALHEPAELYDKIEHNGFVNYFWDYQNKVTGWVDVEHLIQNIINDFSLFFSFELEYISNAGTITTRLIKADSLCIQKYRILTCIEKFPIMHSMESLNFISTYKLKKDYYSVDFGLNKKQIINLLKEQLNELIIFLQIYLKHHTVTEKTSAKSQLKEIAPHYVITFNYTDIYKIYGIETEKVFHVHGSLEKSNVVLGYNDEEENLDFIYFKKYFQRIQKLTGYIDEKKMINHKDGLPSYPLVHFYGHSMDNTDGDILRKLKSLSAGFRIYRYNQEDYEQKVINLFDVFGKDNTIQMIQNGFIQFIDCEE